MPVGRVQALWHPYILSGTVNLLQDDSVVVRYGMIRLIPILNIL
jgi:hypothetical protein